MIKKRLQKDRMKRSLILVLVAVLAFSIIVPATGITGNAKDTQVYNHIIVLSANNNYSAITSIKCSLGDQIFIDMKQLDDPTGRLYLQIIDPFDRVWRSYEIGKECNQISLVLDMPTNGIYKIQVSTIPLIGDDATIAYTITHKQEVGRFRPPVETDIKLPGSFDLI